MPVRRTASKALAVLVEQGLAEYSDGMGHYALAPGHTQGT
jgi:DNA-binding IclR family transcriptional regulator